MTDFALNDVNQSGPLQPASKPNLDKGFNPLTMIIFFGILAAGLLFVAYSIYVDVHATGTRVTTYLPYILLFVALLIALGFEFVNGFHDTANAVATVIYTHSLPAEVAVMWSGFFNFLGVLLLVLKMIVRNPALYAAPEGNKAPPLWIRGLLILTCTGVSFAHGSNDGQKGMGLIMLILIGTVPTAYALNRALPESQVAQFQKTSAAAAGVVAAKGAGHGIIGNPRPAVTRYISEHKIDEGTYPSLAVLVKDVGDQVQKYGSL